MDSLSFPSLYLSAPTSPGGCSPQDVRFYSTMSSPLQKTIDDEFDFASSRRLDDGWIPSMAFADELFCNGKVLPLKLPPRLQRSVPTSPTALRSRARSPFAHRCKWNDDFDPFMVALEKVSEEPGGRTSVHRRSRSHSPRSISRATVSDPAITMIENQGPMARTNHPLKKPTTCGESKIQKVKSVLLRYAYLKTEATKTNEKKRNNDDFQSKLLQAIEPFIQDKPEEERIGGFQTWYQRQVTSNNW